MAARLQSQQTVRATHRAARKNERKNMSTHSPHSTHPRTADAAVRLMTAVINTARRDYAAAYRRSLKLRSCSAARNHVLNVERELSELRGFFTSLLGKYRAAKVLRDIEQTVAAGGTIECEHDRRDARSMGGNPLWN